MKRVSSTSLRTHIECERKAFFEYGPEPRRGVATYPMALGTVGHAILEWRTSTGEDPTYEEVYAMEGNYDDPSVVLDAFADDDIFEHARRCVDLPELAQPRDAIFESLGIPADAKVIEECVELPLETFGLEFECGAVAGGYIDHYLVVEGMPPIVFDWKFRGRMDYAPKEPEDFRSDVQQTYYPAAVQRALGCDSVIVAHGNVLRIDPKSSRAKPKFIPYFAEIPAWYLTSVWSYYEGIAADMVANMAREAHEVDRNEDRCYKYGRPCEHMDYCRSAGQKYSSIMEYARIVAAQRYSEQ